MAKRLVDKKHLEYIASLPCLIHKAGFYAHSNAVQAHHLLKPYDGRRGMSLKAGDNNAIPLCYKHHAMLHTQFGNEFKFFEFFGLPATFGQTWARNYWENKSNIAQDTELPF